MNTVTEPIRQSVIDRLIQSASVMLARSGDGDKHTVAAAVYADDGKIYSGMNLFHFTGGPCAEIVALARLASDAPGARPLAATLPYGYVRADLPGITRLV